jgi:type III secretion protein C
MIRLRAIDWRIGAVLPAVVVAVCWHQGAAFAGEPDWPAGIYKYVVIDQDIREVLVEFGRNTNLPIKLSDQVKGRIRGPLEPGSAPGFLKAVCDGHGLVWYFDGAVLHINAASEIQTGFIDLGSLHPQELTDKLAKLGYADARFPIKATANADVVAVAGPPPYLALIQQTAAAMMRSAPRPAREDGFKDEPKVRVFRGG